MELWDIYDENKERTGRTMKHNDWNMKPGEFHLTVLGVLMRPDGKYLITRRIKNGQQDGGKCLEAVYAPEKIRKMQ